MNIRFSLPHDNRVFILGGDRTSTDQCEFKLVSFDKMKSIQLKANTFNEGDGKTEFSDEKLLAINSDNTSYLKALANAIDWCQKEDGKLVVSRKVEFEGELNSKFVFNQLVKDYTDSFVYLVEVNEATYIGATPEVLLNVKGRKKIETVSLAGTKLGSVNRDWTSKEIDEQQKVTDYISEVLHQFCSKVSIGEAYNSVNGPLVHLKSDLSACLGSEFTLDQLANKLHPTPAVCGLPKTEAYNWIVENEGYNREFYAGYIHVRMNNVDRYFVNLRCLKFKNNRVTLYVGGGITKNSVVEDEYKETENKTRVLLNSIEKIHEIEYN